MKKDYKIKYGTPSKFEFQRKKTGNFFSIICPKYCTGHRSTKKVFIVSLKFKFNCVIMYFYLLSLTTLNLNNYFKKKS